MKFSPRGLRSFLVVLTTGTVLVSGCGDPESKVGVPPDGASPQEVVTAYVAAINAHDEKAGRRLSTPHFAEQQEGVEDGQFENVVEISNLRVESPFPESDYESPEGRSYQDAVYVPVTFTLRQHEVISMPDGDTAWGYVLVRTEPDRPWRINDHGAP